MRWRVLEEVRPVIPYGDELGALSYSGPSGNSAMRPAVHCRPAAVRFIDRVVDATCRHGALAAGRPVRTARCTAPTGNTKPHTVGSMSSTAAGTQVTVRLKGLSRRAVIGNSALYRRHPVVEPPRNLTMNEAKQPVLCACATCPGEACTCGCDQPANTACGCAVSCSCGTACACAANGTCGTACNCAKS